MPDRRPQLTALAKSVRAKPASAREALRTAFLIGADERDRALRIVRHELPPQEADRIAGRIVAAGVLQVLGIDPLHGGELV